MLLIQFKLHTVVFLSLFPFDKHRSVHSNYEFKEATIFGDPLFCYPQMKLSRTKVTVTKDGNIETSNLIS